MRAMILQSVQLAGAFEMAVVVAFQYRTNAADVKRELSLHTVQVMEALAKVGVAARQQKSSVLCFLPFSRSFGRRFSLLFDSSIAGSITWSIGHSLD